MTDRNEDLDPEVGERGAAIGADGPAAADGEGAPGEDGGLVLGDDSEHDAGLHEDILARKTAWSGKIFNVERLEARLPNGRRADRDVVRHGGAAAVVALTDTGKIALVRQYRTALDRVTVEIPAGKLEPGEDPLECAKRELREETGFVAGRIAYLATIATSPGFTDELIHIYFATQLELREASPDEDEFLNVDLVDVRELVDAVLDGKIEDSKTVIGALACDAIAHRLEPEPPGRADGADAGDDEARERAHA